jgi:hypothetical protein
MQTVETMAALRSCSSISLVIAMVVGLRQGGTGLKVLNPRVFIDSPLKRWRGEVFPEMTAASTPFKSSTRVSGDASGLGLDDQALHWRCLVLPRVFVAR